MTIPFRSAAVAMALAAVALAGCQTDSRNQVLAVTKSPTQLRSFQSRVFDTPDDRKVLRAVVATMQDLNFILERADSSLGIVTGTRYGVIPNFQRVRMTVTVRRRGPNQSLVRATAQFQMQALEDPKPYQDFFAALQQALFLEDHDGNWVPPAAGGSPPGADAPAPAEGTSPAPS